VKRGDPESRIPIEALSHIPRATGSDGAGSVSASQRLDQPAGERRVVWHGETPVSDWRWGAQRRWRSMPEGGQLGGGSDRGERGNGAEDKKAEITEGIEKQRAVYNYPS
jgi:hypothetical protein